MLITRCLEVEHTQMQIFIIRSGNNIHSYKHSFNMFITFINGKYGCRSKIDKVTYLIRTRSATSYVAATFHPTIGQRAP